MKGDAEALAHPDPIRRRGLAPGRRCFVHARELPGRGLEWPGRVGRVNPANDRHSPMEPGPSS